mgnify:FL=1|jgi:aminopeptidase C
MKRILTLTFGLLSAVAFAQKNGAITESMLQQIKQQNPPTATDRALRNALAANGINDLTKRADKAPVDGNFTYRVPSNGITDQQSSGRCWLFTGLNVMRARMIKDYKLGEFTLSQSFLSFYDQLEKSNLFLQCVIDYAKEPIDSRQNTWLFEHPLSDGGTFSGVQDLVMKYGVVPAEVFPESYNANNTSKMAEIISLKLRQYGLELRDMVSKGKSATDLQKRKTTMLGEVYHILQICLGTPVEKFVWTLRTADGKAVSTAEYTPKQFYQEFVGKDLKNDYVMLMNDPTRPYYKLYAVDLDRHTYDGRNWTYINLPMNEIKAMAVKSLKDTTMMYMSCDVGKFLDKKTGVLDVDNYDYASLFNTTFPMNKAERIQTHASASSHAMTLMAVGLDATGKTTKWMVENSWGPTYGYKGHLIMTDKWLDEYLFRLVVDKKYVDAKTLDILNQKPTLLPAWDPLFQAEQ